MYDFRYVRQSDITDDEDTPPEGFQLDTKLNKELVKQQP